MACLCIEAVFDKVKDGKVKHAEYVSDEVFFNETVPPNGRSVQKLRNLSKP